MKHITPIAALAIAITSAALCQSTARAGDSQDVVQEITKIENAWATVLMKADVAGQDRIAAPDFLISNFDGSIQTRADVDAELASGAYKCASFKIDEVKIRVYGDTAIAFGLETEKSTYKGADSSGQYRYTDVYVRRNGAWVAVATHVSMVSKAK